MLQSNLSVSNFIIIIYNHLFIDYCFLQLQLLFFVFIVKNVIILNHLFIKLLSLHVNLRIYFCERQRRQLLLFSHLHFIYLCTNCFFPIAFSFIVACCSAVVIVATVVNKLKNIYLAKKIG